MMIDSLTNLLLPLRLGGNLSLDFTNTAEHRQTDHAIEFLPSYAHVLAWCWRSNLLSQEVVSRLQQMALARPSAADSAHQYALRLREAIYGVFSAYAAEESPAPDDARCLTEALGTAMAHRQLALTALQPVWVWTGDADDLTSILWPVALAAGELLTSDDFPRVKRCPGCGWLFLDTSRNGMRRWCSMEACGSQAKSRRQYERKLAEKSQAD
jgi:predicted RNA-binding Zn ribbon-like protein